VVPDFATCTLNHRVAPDRTRDEAMSFARCSFLTDFIDEGDVVTDRRLGARCGKTGAVQQAHLAQLVTLSNAPPRGKGRLDRRRDVQRTGHRRHQLSVRAIRCSPIAATSS
jgi:hypothetical protein